MQCVTPNAQCAPSKFWHMRCSIGKSYPMLLLLGAVNNACAPPDSPVVAGARAQMVQGELRKMQQAQKLAKMSAEEKAQSDRQRWRSWMACYRARLQQEADARASPHTRVELMNGTNPR